MNNSELNLNPTALNRTPSQTASRRVNPITGVGVFVWLVCFALYAFTAGPGIVELFDDSLEFQYVAPTFSIAHPTGYPLYTLLGGIWSRLLFPFGNWAWRMNLFSALAAATAVLLVYCITIRLTSGGDRRISIVSGLAAAIAFALGSVWWSQATIAEVYALHATFVAAILLTSLSIPPLYSGTTSLQRGNPAFRAIMLLCVLVGLSLTHHRTTVLLLPAVAVYLLWSIPGLWRPQIAWFYWISGLILPLALYLYIPIRSAQGIADLNASYVNTVSGFLDHVLARQYAAFFAASALDALPTLGEILSLLWRQSGIVATALAVVGAVMMPFRNDIARKKWALLILALVANGLFAAIYQVADWQVFYIPTFLLIALFAGVGVSIVAGSAGNSRRVTVLAGALVTLVLVGAIFSSTPVNRRADWAAHQYAYLLAAVDYAPDSRVIGIEGEMTALKYMQAAEKMASNAMPITADEHTARLKAIGSSLQRGYPTYITRELPGIESLYSFSGEGPLVRVWPKGDAQITPSQYPLDAYLLDGQLRLQGYSATLRETPTGQVLELALDWLANDSLDRSIKVSLRPQSAQGEPLVDAEGMPVVEDRFPLHQVAPSTTWTPNELIQDVHLISLQASETPTSVTVIAYDADSAEELGRVSLPVQ